MTQMIIFWMTLIVIAIIVEALTTALTSIWFAGGALIALAVAAMNGHVVLQIILFFTVSLILLLFTRPLVMKYFNKNRTRTNSESIIGRKGIVTEEIDNLHATGTVTVDGLEWSARSFQPDEKIKTETVVEILSIDGVKLIVKEEKILKVVT